MAFKLYNEHEDGYVTKGEMNKLAKNLTKDQIDKVKVCMNLTNINYFLLGILEIWFWWRWEVELCWVQEDDEEMIHEPCVLLSTILHSLYFIV